MVVSFKVVLMHGRHDLGSSLGVLDWAGFHFRPANTLVLRGQGTTNWYSPLATFFGEKILDIAYMAPLNFARAHVVTIELP
jgi:hypothetical protein